MSVRPWSKLCGQSRNALTYRNTQVPQAGACRRRCSRPARCKERRDHPIACANKISIISSRHLADSVVDADIAAHERWTRCMRSDIGPIVPRFRDELPAWLDRWPFTRFVTLAFNDPNIAARGIGSRRPHPLLRERLRKWDAFLNRALVGHYWMKRPEDRMFAFYSLEKATVNPHWHGLVRFFEGGGRHTIAEQEAIFDKVAEANWRKLVPSGTVDVQPVHSQTGVARYIAKTLGYPLSYEYYVVPDEFDRG